MGLNSMVLFGIIKILKRERNMRTICGILVLALAIPVYGTTFYSNESTFTATINGKVFKESFEDLPTDSSVSQHQNLYLSDFTLSEMGLNLSVHNRYANGVFATDGSKYVRNTNGLSLKFTFNNPQSFFGINIIDWGDNGPATLSYGDNTGNTLQISNGPIPSDSILFFGIISNQPFTEILLTQTSPIDSWAIDKAYYSIPEPATIFFIGSGLFLTALKRVKLSKL